MFTFEGKGPQVYSFLALAAPPPCQMSPGDGPWSAWRQGRTDLRAPPRTGISHPGKSFPGKEIRRQGCSREQDGAGLGRRGTAGEVGGRWGLSGGSVTVNQGADPSNPASRLS